MRVRVPLRSDATASARSSAIARARVRRRPQVRATKRPGVEVDACAIEAREMARRALQTGPHRFSIVRVRDEVARAEHARIHAYGAELPEMTPNHAVAAIGLRELVA